MANYAPPFFRYLRKTWGGGGRITAPPAVRGLRSFNNIRCLVGVDNAYKQLTLINAINNNVINIINLLILIGMFN